MSTYRLILQRFGEGPVHREEVLLETTEAAPIRRLVANVLPKRQAAPNCGHPGKPIRGWAPEYPEGRLFPTAGAYAKDRGVCQSSINKALDKRAVPVPAAHIVGFIVPDGLKVHPLRGGFFVTEETYLKFRKQAIGE